MAGGIDGFSVLEPVHTLTPVRLLVYSAYAEEAAGFVVDQEFQKPIEQRKLLNRVAEEDSDEISPRSTGSLTCARLQPNRGVKRTTHEIV